MTRNHAPRPATKIVHRYEVPIDDQAHTFTLTHGPHAVAARSVGRAQVVEFWAEHEDRPDVTAAERTFQVFGTGHPIPCSARIVGTADRLDGLVWHLYELFPDDDEFARLFPHARDGGGS